MENNNMKLTGDSGQGTGKKNKLVYLFALCILTYALFVLPACSKRSPVPGPLSPEAGKTLYHCAMHPQIISDKPGECPICHMRLIPFNVGGSPASTTTSSAAVSGLADVHLSPGVEQQIGVSVVPAEMRELSVPMRAAARVAYDPQLYSAALEHQEAVKFLKKAQSQGSSDLVEQAESTVQSSELRLRQMGLSETQIADIAKPSYDPSDLILGSKHGSL